MPFAVLCLPRSRSAWLAHWLSYAGRRVTHDLALDCESGQDFIQQLYTQTGTVETAGMLGGRQLYDVGVKIVVIRRKLAEVEESLRRINWWSPSVAAEMFSRADMLDAISELPGVVTIQFSALSQLMVCAWLWQHLLDIPFDAGWWAALSGVNVQVDLVKRRAKIEESAERIAQFKNELGSQNSLHEAIQCLQQ